MASRDEGIGEAQSADRALTHEDLGAPIDDDRRLRLRAREHFDQERGAILGPRAIPAERDASLGVVLVVRRHGANPTERS